MSNFVLGKIAVYIEPIWDGCYVSALTREDDGVAAAHDVKISKEAWWSFTKKLLGKHNARNKTMPLDGISYRRYLPSNLGVGWRGSRFRRRTCLLWWWR